MPKLHDDDQEPERLSKELRGLFSPDEIQHAHFGVLTTLLARNHAWTMASINLQRNILLSLGYSSDELEAHVNKTVDKWHAQTLENVKTLFHELLSSDQSE